MLGPEDQATAPDSAKLNGFEEAKVPTSWLPTRLQKGIKTARHRLTGDPEVDEYLRAKEIKCFSIKRPYMRAFHFSWLSFFLAFTGWFALAPLTPFVRVSLGLCANGSWEDFDDPKECDCDSTCKRSLANANIVALSGTIGMRLAIGPLAEMYGARTAQCCLLVVFSIPLALSGLAKDIRSFSRARFFIGGMGATFVVTQFWTSEMFSSSIVGTANATTAGWGNLGGGFTQILMPVIFSWFEGLGPDLAWRTAVIVPAVMLQLVALSLYLFSDDVPEGKYRDLFQKGMKRPEGGCLIFLTGAMDVRVWLLAIIYGGCFGTELTMNNVLYTYFFDYWKLTTQEAGIAASTFGLMNLFCRSMGGMLSDYAATRWDHRGRHWVFFLTQSLVGFMLLAFSQVRQGEHPFALAIVVLILFSTFVQMAEGAQYAIVPFVGRHIGALGPVAGIIAAGGNAGAVGWGFIYRYYASSAYSPRIPFQVHGLCVIGTALLIPLVHYNEFGSVFLKAKKKLKQADSSDLEELAVQTVTLPNGEDKYVDGIPTMHASAVSIVRLGQDLQINDLMPLREFEDVKSNSTFSRQASACITPGITRPVFDPNLILEKPTPPTYNADDEKAKEVKSSLRDFVDTSVASESAAFISYKPVTTAFRNIPFQIFAALVALNYLVLGLIYWFENPAMEDFLGLDHIFRNHAEKETEAARCFILTSIIIFGIAAARLGKPQLMTWAFALCHLTSACMHAVLAAELFADGKSMGEFWLFFAIGYAIPIYVFVWNEVKWAEALLCRGVVHIVPCVMNFIDTYALVNFILSVEGLMFISITSITICRRRIALDRALAATKPDQENYDKVWHRVVRHEERSLRDLGCVAEQSLYEKRLQPSTRLEILYPMGRVVNKWYQEVVASWAAYAGMKHHRSEVKSLHRTMEKIWRSYKGRVPPVLDIVRASLVCNKVSEATNMLRIVLNNSKVHVIKNRFDLYYDSAITAGYRDLNLQLTFEELQGTAFEGFVFELQIHLQGMLALKNDQGHKRYIQLRNMRGD